MYCSNCGNQISDQSKFCSFCGSHTQSVQQPMTNAPDLRPNNTVPANTPNPVTAAQNRYSRPSRPERSAPSDPSSVRQCCPNCGSDNLSVVSESTTSGSDFNAGNGCLGYLLLGPLGLLCGLCGSNKTTTTKTLWVCQNCGEKFRRLQDIETEKEGNRTRTKALKILMTGLGILEAVLSLVLLVGFFIDEVPSEGLPVCIVGLLIGAGSLLLGLLAIPSSGKKTEQQLCDEEEKLRNASRRD